MRYKHPASLWGLSSVYALFAFAFGPLMANLLLYFTQQQHLPEGYAYQLYASFGCLVFTLPLLGGYLCDYFGFKNSALSGLIICVISFLCFYSSSNTVFFIGISLFLIGNSLATPAIWSLVGLSYRKSDPNRESGTTIFYIWMNAGFLLTNLTSGYVATIIGYNTTFLLYGLAMVLALILFVTMSKSLVEYRSEAEGDGTNFSGVKIAQLLIILMVATPIIFFLLDHLLINNIILWLLVIGSFILLINLSRKPEIKPHRKKLIAFMILCLVAVGYLIIYNTEFGLLPEYAHHSINRELLGLNLPSSIILSFDNIFVIILGAVYSYMWVILARKNKTPNLPTKFSAGLIFAALGYLLLALLVYFNLSSKISILWLVLVFMLFTAGELLVIPIGIAMAGKLSPPGKEGLLMGVWTLMTGWSALLTGYVAFLTAAPTHGTLTQLNTQYFNVFLGIGIVVMICGLVMWAVKGKISRLL